MCNHPEHIEYVKYHEDLTKNQPIQHRLDKLQNSFGKNTWESKTIKKIQKNLKILGKEQ